MICTADSISEILPWFEAISEDPRELLLAPVLKGFVNKAAMEKELFAGMELFIDEVVDFSQNYITHMNLAEFFDKLIVRLRRTNTKPYCHDKVKID